MTTPLIDTKTVGRLRDFTGEEADWELWKFRFEGWCSLLDQSGVLSHLLQLASEQRDVIDSGTLGDAAGGWSHLLYGLFSQVFQGKAASICMRVQKRNGLETWRQITQQYEPNIAGRHTAVLMSLLHPPWQSSEGKYRNNLSTFVVDLLEWERKIARYEQETREVFADRMKIATVFKHGPLELKRVLQAHSQSIGANYAVMRAHIETFINSGREFDSAGITARDQGPQPMDVGALTKGFGKGSKKGKSKSHEGKGKPQGSSSGGTSGGKPSGKDGKGKGAKATGKGGQFQGNCSFCGRWGHKRVDCWKRPVAGAIAETTAREPVASSDSGNQTTGAVFAANPADAYIFAVCAGVSASSMSSILIDSGSDAHVVPKGFFQYWGITPGMFDSRKATLHTIDGSKIQVGSSAAVWITISDEEGQQIQFRTLLTEGGVSMGVLSAGLLEDIGMLINLGTLTVTLDKSKVRMKKQGKKYAVRCSLSSTAKSSTSSWPSSIHDMSVVAPIEGEETQLPPGQAVAEGTADDGHALGEAEPVGGEPVFDERSKVRDLRARLRELQAPTWGAKTDLLKRVCEYTERRAKERREQQELEERHRARLEGQPLIPFRSQILAPSDPTPMEREIHELTHIPTASWCEHCIRGKAKSAPHGQQHPVMESAKRPPAVQLDFMYMAGVGESDPPRCFLTLLDEQSSYPSCLAMPGKTVTDYMVEVVLEFLSRLGHQVVQLYSDGEPAIYNLMVRVQAKRGSDKTLLKHTPRYSSQSLGLLGVYQQMLQGMIRTLKLHLEARYSRKIEVKDNLFTWLARHAGWLVARFHTRAGQQTSFEINTGAAYSGKIVSFAETVMFKHPVSSTGALAKHVRRAKAETTWEKGLWIGKTERSDEQTHCLYPGRLLSH